MCYVRDLFSENMHGAWLPTPVRSFNVRVSMRSGLGTRLARNELCVGGARTLVLAVTSERGENHTGICIIPQALLLIQCLRGRVGEMERQWRNPSDVMKTRSIRKKKVRPHTCWLCSLIVLARVKITLSSCVQLQRASSLGGLNKENSPLKSVNRSVNESGAVRKRTAGIALGEQENCPSALTATRTKNSSLCSPSTKVHWPNTANYSLHDTPQVLCACSCHEHT